MEITMEEAFILNKQGLQTLKEIVGKVKEKQQFYFSVDNGETYDCYSFHDWGEAVDYARGIRKSLRTTVKVSESTHFERCVTVAY